MLAGGLILFFVSKDRGVGDAGAMMRIGQSPPITIEIADTESARVEGLSGRSALSENAGMLFVFDVADYHTFWMKDMQFPIDIIWIRDGLVVGVSENLMPEGPNPTAIYAPPKPVDSVLEVFAGFVEEHGIRAGDAVTF